MNDNIEARFDWALDPGSGECVIGHGNDFSLPGDFRDRFKIDQLQQRIARRFDPNHARVWFDRALEIFGVGQIDIAKIKIRRASPHSIEQSERAAVKIVTGDDMRTAFEQLQHGRHTSEPRCKRESARAAFQIGNALFVGEPGGID